MIQAHVLLRTSASSLARGRGQRASAGDVDGRLPRALQRWQRLAEAEPARAAAAISAWIQQQEAQDGHV
jgi:hypothetical protein